MGRSWGQAGPLPCEGEVFAIEVRADGLAIVLVLRGELDLAGTPRLEAALQAATAAGHERIVLDLRRLAFIDATSVGLIERTKRQLRARGDELTLRNPRRQVRRVIELCAGMPR
jgi:anti-anti-sigma factor